MNGTELVTLDGVKAVYDNLVAMSSALQADITAFKKAVSGLGIYIVSPEDIAASAGSTVILSAGIVPANLDPAPTYQWQNRQFTTVDAAWTNSHLTGSTTASITIPVIDARYNYEWRCVVTYNDTKYYTTPCRIVQP